ncbi:MAG TPA: alpha/beta hydrolase [Jatrophihabitans sp.]|jgi:pimeloyl-ACP methyl ester carboxylesterase|uniref:alpha/beta fold hydrolase n=1 Tax=Jatrophihabitans sp. TaxID=1932789 RepID=UPI002E06E98B|nr:alpha/beta hydrolase [Jatrophihabitans sp.]
MRIERGTAAAMPYAQTGSGRPIVFLAGLSPVTGVARDRIVRTSLGTLGWLAGTRRITVFNRRPGLPQGMPFAEFAAEQAAALRALFDAPVDVIGLSTGGSIAQQLAADHPDVVDRLVLLSTACRLGPLGRDEQREVGQEIRAGRHRRAMAVAAAGLVPHFGARPVVGTLGWLLAHRAVSAPHDFDDLATTVEAEDTFDLARCADIVRARTLIVAGRRDRFYGVELFEETARLIPDSELHVLDRGHITVLRDPTLRPTLEGFLAR